MKSKFDKLFETIEIGYPISVNNPSPHVYDTVTTDIGKDLNDELLAWAQDLIGRGKATNEYHPRNLKVRQFQNQLMVMPREVIIGVAENLGLANADMYETDDIVYAIINVLGEAPENYDIVKPLVQEACGKDHLLDEEDPCWDSHEMVGMKKKNGKTVPNCVPKEQDMIGDIPVESEGEMEEAIKKKRVIRNGKKEIIARTDKEGYKVVDGKEVRMSAKERKNRSKAAKKTGKRAGTRMKRAKQLKKSLKKKK